MYNPFLPRARHALIPIVIAALLLPTRTVSAQTEPGADGDLRVVALGGSVTETIYALEAGGLLVGVDRSSVWPPDASELPDVGYYRTLGAEGVLSLEPDLVIAAEGAGPPPVLEQLRNAGVRLVEIPEWESVDGAVQRVRAVAAALSIGERGERLATRMEAEIARAESLLSKVTDRPRALFVWGRAGGPLLAAGRDTGAKRMLEAAGARNAIDGFADYKPLSPEAAIAAAPDVIVAPRSTVEDAGGVEALLARPGLAGTPAAASGRIVVVDLLAFLGFGPRTGPTLETLVRDLHVELRADADGP